METILIMLSGGLDSVYMLYYYLTETNHPLHVHHISLRYPQLRRWPMEDPASKKIVDYCRQTYRDFDYSESRFDMEELNEVGMDSDLHLLVGSKLAPNLEGDKITLALGHLYDDDPLLPTPHRVDKVWWALLERVRLKEKINRDIGKPLLEKEITKQYVCQNMPDDLLRMCWSCRMPDYSNGSGVPCGWCNTCERIEKVFKEMGRAADFPNLVRSPSLGPCPGRQRVQTEDPSQMPQTLQPRPPLRAGQTNVIAQPSPRTAIPAPPAADPVIASSPDIGREARDNGYSPWFKVQVAFAAMVNGQTDEQLAARYSIAPYLVGEWKHRLQHEIRLAAGGTAKPHTGIEARVEDLYHQFNELKKQVSKQRS